MEIRSELPYNLRLHLIGQPERMTSQSGTSTTALPYLTFAKRDRVQPLILDQMMKKLCCFRDG